MKKIILALFILYLPFQLRIPQVPVINTVNLFLILLALIFFFGQNPSAPRARFDTPLLLFLLVWIISFIHTLCNPGVIPGAGGVWRYEASLEFKRLFTLVLAYFVFARCLKTKKELQFLFFVFLISVILVGLHTWRNGMLAGVHFADFKRSSGPFALGFKGSDIAGGFLAILAPFVLTQALFTKRTALKLIWFSGFTICVAGLFTTYSRGSILGLGLGVIMIILFSLKSVFKASKLSAALLLIIILFSILGWRSWVPQSIIHRAEGTVVNEGLGVEATYDESTEKRINIWKIGWELFLENPLFGIGFRQARFRIGLDTHNAFILIAAEMGIFGIAIFIWFLWRIFQQAVSLFNTEFLPLGVGYIGCLTSFIVVNMFYSNFFRDTVVGSLWVVLGLLAASKQYALKIKAKKG